MSTSLFSQKKLVGDWKISEQKQLNLSKDNDFVLVKGPNVFKGKWKYYDKKNDSNELVLYFDSDTRKYIIEDIEKNEIRLYDPLKEAVMILTRIPEVEEKEANEELDSDTNTQAITSQATYKFDPFDRGRFVISPGYGLVSYLDSLPSNLENKVASFSLLLESSIGRRVGIGLKLGYTSWVLPESTYELSLYTAAARLTYHPFVIEKLDLFAGVSPIVRYGTVVVENGNEFKWSADISPVIGARYYLFDRFAVSGEFAYDTSSNITLGFAVLLN